MKTIDVKKTSVFLSIAREKCPHCHRGDVFEKNRGLLKIPQMKNACDACQYKFEREPGYFLGAMYISYAITVVVGIITFLTLHILLPELPTIYVPTAMILVIAVISKWNFRLSRIIYMHLFPW